MTVIDIKPRETDPVPETPPFIAIGIPSVDFVDADFMMSIASQCQSFRGVTMMVNSKGCYIDLGRMKCLNAAREATATLSDGRIIKPTHLMFFDSDMTFPNHTIQRLMSHDKDIVGCIYSMRIADKDGNIPNIGRTVGGVTSMKTYIDSPLVDMELLPTGILLIKMSVFDKLPDYDDDGPIFGYRWMKDLKAYEREDVRFCRIAREHGFNVWCDPWLSMQIGHIGQSVYRITEESKQQNAPHAVSEARTQNAIDKGHATVAAE